jgi:hypothetical protein
MPTPPRVRNGIPLSWRDEGIYRPVLVMSPDEPGDDEPWGSVSDPDDEAPEDADPGYRIWDTYKCGRGSGNIFRRINE